ncbi:MAG: hypothetical protein E7528_07600 [Ruminococcaceae bacterium]|nr:hypothetical protein [Oscillospiraceae bacterium]
MSKKVLTVEQAEIKAMKKARSSDRWISFLALILAVAVAVAAVSIGKSFSENKKAGEVESYITDDTVNQNSNIENTTPDNSQNQSDNNQQQQTPQQETVNKDEISDDPSQWSKEQIVYMYKQAATKSHDTAESSQTMSMPTMVVNDGDGALGFFINMVKPVIDSVIKKQATTYGGITGGYKNLVVSDVESAKAYKEGNYTVIEMRMVEQTDGLYGDPQAGTVGHAINVLGNVATAVEQFPDFDIKYEEADIKIHYADPIVKVRINENGMIEKGTWSYMTEIDIKHLAIGSVMVDKAYAEIEYVIVVGGGF